MTTVALTDTQYEKILMEERQVETLSKEEVERIATYLNNIINIPFAGEAREQVLFVKAVRSIDRFIHHHLPSEIYSLIHDSLDGISPQEADLINERLATIINHFVNIPYVPEKLEQKIFEVVLGMVCSALIKGRSLLIA